MPTTYKTFPVSTTATDTVAGQYVSYYDAFTVGVGYVDLGVAVKSTAVPAGSALSPSVIFDTDSQRVRFQADPSSTWYIDAQTGSTFSPMNVWGNTNLSVTGALGGGLSGPSVDASGLCGI